MADGIQSRFEQPMLQPVFAAKALTKTYVSGEVKVHALNNVDLQIAEKEVVVLLGPSGGGKSMLLNIMGGLDRPTSGQLFFRDSDLTVLEDRELTIYRREHVGFVFQFYNLIPSLTAYENVALVAEVTKNPMRPAAGRARGTQRGAQPDPILFGCRQDHRHRLRMNTATSAFDSQVRKPNTSAVTSPSFALCTLVQLVQSPAKASRGQHSSDARQTGTLLAIDGGVL
jgi:ABC-type sugar transport system ATPase subunit